MYVFTQGYIYTECSYSMMMDVSTGGIGLEVCRFVVYVH